MDTVDRVLVKPRVHKIVVKELAVRILDRRWTSGMALPTEPELCEELNVSRSALREAIKVLGSKGLLTTRPRVGTVIQPTENWNLLDEDLLRWSMDLAPSPQLVLSLIEARQAIEPAAARLAASRASARDIDPIERAFDEMSRYKAEQDFEAFNNADIAFHTALLRASGNVVFHQLANMIGTALAYSFRVTMERAREPGASLPNHGEVIERIRARDAEGAFASMSRLLNIAVVDLGLGSGSFGTRFTDSAISQEPT
ncbi:transcriptional regulator [Devosia pacifica]|uniref:Transcriptional regulator n=1 Tax=Devosia pacifica TaxID=1335967 RepID=A0A918S3F1_9HYPH|nr:FadR/GntR family transcriptional regulator [Devosia pacifica]GHA21905.1 transcriptional regulator [Devosia pacifica]